MVIINYCDFSIREKTKGCGTKETIVGFACLVFDFYLIDANMELENKGEEAMNREGLAKVHFSNCW